jgi:hypothetical protein
MKIEDSRIKTPPALSGSGPAGRDAADLRSHPAAQAQQVAARQEIVDQRERLAKAELLCKKKLTKKASEDQRIATNKIERARKSWPTHWTDTKNGDARYPGYYVPVLIMEMAGN